MDTSSQVESPIMPRPVNSRMRATVVSSMGAPNMRLLKISLRRPLDAVLRRLFFRANPYIPLVGSGACAGQSPARAEKANALP